MTHKDLKKILRSAGIGGMFGTGIRLFDMEYAEVSFPDMSARVDIADAGIKEDGLIWAEDGLDCDTLTLFYMADVLRGWAKEHTGKGKFPAYPFGRAHMKGHDTNIGVADGKVYFWDYGELKYFDPKIIDEAEFK